MTDWRPEQDINVYSKFIKFFLSMSNFKMLKILTKFLKDLASKVNFVENESQKVYKYEEFKSTTT